MIDEAMNAPTRDAAARAWHQADQQVMAGAAIFPITSPKQPNYHAEQVHNAVYVPAFRNFDPANVWLDPTRNGG